MRFVRVLLVLILVATGCTSEDSPDATEGLGGQSEPTPAPDSSAGSEASAAPEPAAEPTASDAEPTETESEEATEAEPAVDANGVVEGEYPTDDQIRELGSVATCGYYQGEEDLCQDSDGNAWPDFLEAAVGRDPLTDDCIGEGCDVEGIEDFLAEVQGNTLFILDSSGSMAGDAGSGQTKMEAAKDAIVRYATAAPEFLDLGLMVYGHQGDNSDAGRAESCAGIETFAPIGDLRYDNVEEVVGQFQPTGWTPIAASLDAAAAELEAATAADESEGTSSSNRIVIISDGLETCDGDPVASAEGLLGRGIEVVVDVIGFDLAEADRASLEEVARVTGGTYTDARTGADLREVLNQYIDQNRRLLEAAACNTLAAGDVGGCNGELRGDIVTYNQEELLPRVREEQGREDHSFLRTWVVQAQRENQEVYRPRVEELRERNDEIYVLYAEADARLQAFEEQRDGSPRKPYVPLDCPYRDDEPEGVSRRL